MEKIAVTVRPSLQAQLDNLVELLDAIINVVGTETVMTMLAAVKAAKANTSALPPAPPAAYGQAVTIFHAAIIVCSLAMPLLCGLNGACRDAMPEIVKLSTLAIVGTIGHASNNQKRSVEQRVYSDMPREPKYDSQPGRRKGHMKWIYRIGMAASVVGAALVSGGILPVAWAGVAVAVGTASGFFHEAPGPKAP